MLPPFKGVAVNVTGTPAQIEEPGFAEIEMDGVRIGFTVMTMALLVSVSDVAHTALFVITQVITSFVLSVDDVKEVVLVPVFTPLTFH